jgi:hypothetical protein
VDLPTTRALTALRRLINTVRLDLAKLSALALPNIPRKTTVPINNLVNGAANAQTLTASWTIAVSGDYRVIIQTVVAAARVGTIHASIVAGTKNPTSVDITVVNLGASTLVLGSLDVVIHPD